MPMKQGYRVLDSDLDVIEPLEPGRATQRIHRDG
jgi:hypothetical protein